MTLESLMPSIQFGGFFFIAIAAVFLIAQSVLLFNNKNGLSLGILAAYAGAMFFLVDDWPQFNYRWLLVYPLLALMWLPVYWYFDLLRRSAKLKSLIIQYGNLEVVHDKGYTNDIKASRGHYEADIKHPHVDDLFANTLLFPVSIPLFFGENALRMFIDYMKQWMEEVRKKMNASINSFKV